jgi:hypothetical protein
MALFMLANTVKIQLLPNKTRPISLYFDDRLG